MITNEEKALSEGIKYGHKHHGQGSGDEWKAYEQGYIDGCKWKDEQFIETAQEDAESYVKGMAKANPDLSACVLNLLETAYIAGRNRIK